MCFGCHVTKDDSLRCRSDFSVTTCPKSQPYRILDGPVYCFRWRVLVISCQIHAADPIPSLIDTFVSPAPTIDRTIVASIVASIEQLQGDVELLLDACGLSASWSDRDAEMLPEDRVWKLFEVTGNALDLPDIGTRIGADFQVHALGAFGRMLESSLTAFTCLTEYINTVNRYSSHSRFWLETREGGAWFCRQGIDLIEVGRREVEQFTLELMIRLAQLACGRTWMPTEIGIKESSDRFLRDNSRYDATKIQCGQPATAIWLSSSNLFTTVDWTDDEIIQLIRDSIKIGCHAARPTVASVAGQLGFSVRTLQRELSLHGLDWSRLLDQVRLSRATEQLRTDTPIAEIAGDLRYTDQANFGRAFRRWTGVTPKSYRRLLTEEHFAGAE